MKHILLFIDSLGAGGAQRQLAGLAVMLQKRGYGVKVVTYYNHPFYLHVLQENGIAYSCLNIKSKRCLPKLLKVIREFNADCIISYQTDPNIMACLAAAITGTRLIVSERNTHQSVSFKDRIAFFLYRWAAFVVPNSFSEESFLRAYCSSLKSKLMTIPNFVDLDHFAVGHRQIRHIAMRLVVVASVKESKNTKNFILAFKKAVDAGLQLTAEWYGVNPKENDLAENNAYTDECMQMISQLNLKGQLKLLPKIKNIAQAYREADVFCLPSHFEGTPNAICEAMAASLPVVCSRVCDNSRYVEQGVNGMLFDPDNVDEMAQVLLAVDKMSVEQLQAWGKNSRERAEKMCNKKNFTESYISLIES